MLQFSSSDDPHDLSDLEIEKKVFQIRSIIDWTVAEWLYQHAYVLVEYFRQDYISRETCLPFYFLGTN